MGAGFLVKRSGSLLQIVSKLKIFDVSLIYYRISTCCHPAMVGEVWIWTQV